MAFIVAIHWLKFLKFLQGTSELLFQALHPAQQIVQEFWL